MDEGQHKTIWIDGDTGETIQMDIGEDDDARYFAYLWQDSGNDDGKRDLIVMSRDQAVALMKALERVTATKRGDAA
jgi:hypothetical protein